MINETTFDFNTTGWGMNIDHDLLVGFKAHTDKINRDQYTLFIKEIDLVSIHLFMTDFKKEIPKSTVDVIDVMNVNSGLSDVCQRDSEIIIYRKEEWFKVFIHETFHSLGLDFSNYSTPEFEKGIS